MSLASWMNLYLTLNFLIVAAFSGLFICGRWGQCSRQWSYQSQLKFHYVSLISILILVAASPFFSHHSVFEPAIKVWASDSLAKLRHPTDLLHQDGAVAFAGGSVVNSVSSRLLGLIWAGLGLLSLGYGIFRWSKDIFWLRQMRRQSYLCKKIGGVAIYWNENIQIPFSYSFGVTANVVLPSSLILSPKDQRIAILHELQHHRQKDTIWIYAMRILRGLCPVNPFMHLWGAKLAEIQEFACDEALIDHGKVDSRDYARCLVEVAQTALDQERLPVGAMGMNFLVEGHLLRRRIENMLQKKRIKTGRSIRWAMGLFLGMGLATTVYASKGFVQDRRVSLAQAQEMAKTIPQDGFPIVINDLVLAQLNIYVGTPEGREFMKSSLERMGIYQAGIEQAIAGYQLPKELLAIPLVESGYQNLPEQHHQGWGAGLWMFIVSTAQKFGLRVNAEVDERLNVPLETDAAMRYLSVEHLRFKDWLLAVMSYNIGERSVQNAIDEVGSRDAWSLIRQGFAGKEPDYLPKLTAMILIMNHPESIQ